MKPRADTPQTWVLLSYRVPREPSTPRIAIWRKLKRLGVAQLSDGLVALPADARSREALEWIAADVVDAGGTATVWLGRPAAGAAERELVATMAESRAEEYRAVLAEARAAALSDRAARSAALRKLRGELGRIYQRDFFPPPEREAAQAAVEALVEEGSAATVSRSSR